MDNSNYSRDRHNEHLGVNKIGKNIRKSPLHQPNYGNVNKPQPPQPHVYNISKNDFRNIVQQLTGSPSHNQPPPRPTHNPPRPPSMRLQRIRPPPLTPITRPPPYMAPPPLPMQPGPSPRFNNNNYGRSAPMGQQQPLLLPLQHRSPRGDAVWANTAESPISQYMRYLQNSMMEPSPRPPQGPPQPHMPGLLPTPPGNVPFPSSRGNGLSLANTPFPSPRGNGPSFANSSFPSPRGAGPSLLPSPGSQYAFPSPGAFTSLLSPRSPYPLVSPGFQYAPPLTPNFFSGILGPGPQPPNSPGIMFPSSPSGFFPIISPRWRGY